MLNISFRYISESRRKRLIPVRNYLDDSYRYTFGGKEEQPELGLNWIDHHARNYMPDIVRTIVMDPLVDKFVTLSPYSFLNNSPLRTIDPTGAEAVEADEETAKKIFERLKNEINSKGDKKREDEEEEEEDFEGVLGNGGGEKSNGTEQQGPVNEDNSSSFSDRAERASGDEMKDKINVAIGAFGFSQNIKHEIIESAVKGSKSISGVSGYLSLSKGFGTGLGVLSAGINSYQYDSGQMSGFQYTAEIISTGISVKLPAWGIGWELGRLVTQMPGYQENFRLPIRRFVGLD